jgi:predicted lipoprotein
LLAANPLNEAAVRDAGAAGKGLYALEYLLFVPDGADQVTTLLGPQAASRRSLARLLAADFEQAVGRVQAAALRTDLPATFAARGVEGLGRVVNDLLETVETVVTGRLEYVSKLNSMQSLGRGRLEGEPSGTSLLSTQAMLEGARAMYRGQTGGAGGLSALVRAAAPAVDKDVLAAFEAASQSLAAMQAGLETEIVRHPDRLSAARAACHRLELALKTGVLSALGVTLLFRSTDGD